MTEHEPVYGAPRAGEAGDCLRACLATVLDLPLRRVPHFVQKHEYGWLRTLQRWLRDRGWASFYYRFDLRDPAHSHMRPDGFWIAVVDPDEKKGESHAIVMRGRYLYHVPNRYQPRSHRYEYESALVLYRTP